MPAPTPVKVAENRQRRAAARQGLTLEKCRRRDPRALGYGTYRLVNSRGRVVFGGSAPDRFGLTLVDVAEFLAGRLDHHRPGRRQGATA